MTWSLPPSSIQRLVGILPILLALILLYLFEIGPWMAQWESYQRISQLQQNARSSVTRSLAKQHEIQQQTQDLKVALETRVARFETEAWTPEKLLEDLGNRERAKQLRLREFRELSQSENGYPVFSCRFSTSYEQLCQLLKHWNEQTWPPTIQSMRISQDRQNRLDIEIKALLFAPSTMRNAS